MVKRMQYKPEFSRTEFHRPSGHYEIEIAGRRLLYAYIRKNACTAFKHMLNRKPHPKFVLNRAIGRERNSRYHISGNMKYYRVHGDLHHRVSSYDHILFVYRDPLDRFLSVFINKFIDNAGATDIQNNFIDQTGKDVEISTFRTFMDYANREFSLLDCHMWPQKAHLEAIRYTDAIALGQLRSSMAEIIGQTPACKWFEGRRNSSRNDGTRIADHLSDVPVCRLRELQKQGKRITKANFISELLSEFIIEKYTVDYDMISCIHRGSS